jgi:hypothetical protein
MIQLTSTLQAPQRIRDLREHQFGGHRQIGGSHRLRHRLSLVGSFSMMRIAADASRTRLEVIAPVRSAGTVLTVQLLWAGLGSGGGGFIGEGLKNSQSPPTSGTSRI